MDEIYSHKNRTDIFNQHVLYEIRVHGHQNHQNCQISMAWCRYVKSDFGNLIKFLEKRADANTLIVYTYVCTQLSFGFSRWISRLFSFNGGGSNATNSRFTSFVGFVNDSKVLELQAAFFLYEL